MEIRSILALLLFLCCINVAAAAEYDYWIARNNDVAVPISISGNSNLTLYVENIEGYSPDGDSVFMFYSTFEDLDGWSVVSTKQTLLLSSGQVLNGAYSAHDNAAAARVMQRNDLNSNNAIYEIEFYDAQTSGGNGVFQRYIDGNQFIVGVSNQQSNSYYVSRYGSTWAVSSIPRSVGWHSAKIVLEGSTAKIYLDGTLLQTRSYSVVDSYLAVGDYWNDGVGGDFYFEDLRIRKYISSEPSYNVIPLGDLYRIDIHNNNAEALTDYQLLVSGLNVSSSTESLKISDVPPYPEVEVTLTSPASGSYIADNTLSFNISGMGNFSAIVYIDSSAVWSGTVSAGINQITPSISQSSHSWYVVASATVEEETVSDTSATWTFTYDTIDPSPSSVVIIPEAANIAAGTLVNTNIRWSDTNFDYAQFYVNYGSGFVLEDSINFASSLQWFNTSIDTTGYIGETITWKQVAYDEAGNSYIYSDSFAVVLNALNIYVYDETTGAQILPSNVVVYNEDISQEATISGITKVASLTYTNLTTGKYIVNVAAEGYYTRRAIMMVDVTSLSEMNVYLPSTNETIIYGNFKLSDNTRIYEPTDIILRLDKPMPIGTETIFSSYFDFAGSTATYMIASDQYILYIITPTATYNYGWLTPDPDGQIDININRFTFETVEEWIQYTYNESQAGVSFSYSSTEPISAAYMIVNKNGVEDYNATATTTSGQFTYLFSEEGIYTIEVRVISEDNPQFIRNSVVQVGAGKTINPFPEGYTLALKSVVVAFIIVVGMLASSSYRADLSCMYGASVYAFAVYQDWCIGNAYTVSIVGIIAVAAIVKFQRKNDRSV